MSPPHELNQHKSNNKLRDTESELVDEGHAFSWNSEILYSFDVCAHCEAHALWMTTQLHRHRQENQQQQQQQTQGSVLQGALLLKEVKNKALLDSPSFVKCPKPEL